MNITRARLIEGHKSVFDFITGSLPVLFIGADMGMVRGSLTISVDLHYFRLIYREDEFSKYVSKQLPYGDYGWLVFGSVSLD